MVKVPEACLLLCSLTGAPALVGALAVNWVLVISIIDMLGRIQLFFMISDNVFRFLQLQEIMGG